MQSKVHTPKLIKMLTQINTNDVLITKGSPFVSPEEIVDNASGFNALLPSLLYDVGWPLNALWCFLREHLHTVQWFTPTTTFGRSHWVGFSQPKVNPFGIEFKVEQVQSFIWEAASSRERF